MPKRATATVIGVCIVIAVGACARQPPAATPEPTPTPIPLATRALITKASAIVADIFAERYARARSEFNAAIRAGLSEQQLRDTRSKFLSMFGEFRSQGRPRSVDHEGRTIVTIPLIMTKQPAQAQVTFDADGRVAGLFLQRRDTAGS